MAGGAENLQITDARIAATFTRDDVVIVYVSCSKFTPATLAAGNAFFVLTAFEAFLFGLGGKLDALHIFMAR